MAPATHTATSPLTHCPTCGAKRTRPDSTLCAYCATPFGLVGGAPKAEQDGPPPHLARLARMPDQPGFAEADAWVPLESYEYQLLDTAKRRGLVLNCAGWLLAGATGLWLAAWFYVPAGLLIVAGIALSIRSASKQRRILARPLLKRPAIVTDRRSETAMGYWNGQTTYYFDLAFADGSEGEFRWPGRGVDHAPLVTGATGVAFTRGDTLLGFNAIRV